MKNFITCSLFAIALSWSSSVSAYDAYATQVVSDSSGNSASVWLATDDTTFEHVIQGATFVSGGSWSSPTTISSNVDENASAPKLAIDTSGNVVAVWSTYDENLGVALIKISSLAAVSGGSWGSWGSPVTVSTTSEYVLDDFQITADASGKFVVTWTSYLNSDPFFSVARVSSAPSYNGTWTTPVTLSD